MDNQIENNPQQIALQEPTQTAVFMANQNSSQTDTETFAIAFFLVYFYPIGIILMWLRMKNWPLWGKIFLSLPGFLVILGVIAILLSSFIIHSKSRP